MKYYINKTSYINWSDKFYVTNEEGNILLIENDLFKNIIPRQVDLSCGFALPKNVEALTEETKQPFTLTSQIWKFNSIEEAEKALNIYLSMQDIDIVKTINV